MRVLHVADSERQGGAEVVFNATIEATAALGYEVHSLVSDSRRSPLSYILSYRWYRQMIRSLKELRPDIVHLQNFYHFLSPSVLLAIRDYRKKHRVRVVFTAHDYHLVCPNSGLQSFPHGVRTTLSGARIPLFARYDHRGLLWGMLKSFQHLVAYKLLRLDREIDLILSPSQTLASTFKRLGVTTPIMLVRNPSLWEIMPPESIGSGWVYAGRLSVEKGLPEFIELADSVGEEQSLTIYGTGPDLSRIAAAADRAENIRVHLAGHVEAKQLRTDLPKFGLFVYPSLCPENAPMALVEAIQSGLPVLVPEGSGCEEIAQASLSWASYEPSNRKSLERALSAVEGLSSNSFFDSSEFTPEEFTRAIQQAYYRDRERST